MWHVGDGMGWWMLWGGLMMIFFWGAIIALVVGAIQALTRREAGYTESRQTSPSPRPPLGIAKERYARGDIARDEFEQIKKDLEGS
jgi:putative membrane protein